MNDVITQKPLQVMMTPTAGPYLRLPYSQLEQVKQVLDSHGVYYWVSESVLSLNGGPQIAKIYFGFKGDARAIQAILDGAN